MDFYQKHFLNADKVRELSTGNFDLELNDIVTSTGYGIEIIVKDSLDDNAKVEAHKINKGNYSVKIDDLEVFKGIQDEDSANKIVRIIKRDNHLA